MKVANNSKLDALAWWNTITFEQRFFATIKWLKSKGEDTTSKHPNSLTSEEIEEIWFTSNL